ADLSADGKTLVTLGMGTLAVWDVPTGRRTYYDREPETLNAFEPGNVAVAPDGSWVASVSRSKATIRVIDLTTGKERMKLGAFERDPVRNAFDFRSVWATAEGKVILLCDSKSLIAYDLTTGKQLRKVPLPGRVVALSPDGKRVATHDQESPANAAI